MLPRFSIRYLGRKSDGLSNYSILFSSFSSPYFGKRPVNRPMFAHSKLELFIKDDNLILNEYFAAG